MTLAAFTDALSHALPAQVRHRVDLQRGRVASALERLLAVDGGLRKFD